MVKILSFVNHINEANTNAVRILLLRQASLSQLFGIFLKQMPILQIL